MSRSEKLITELIEATGGNITAKEVAEKLHYSSSMVHQVVKKYNLSILNSRKDIYKKRYSPCENRPQGCFECPYEECICNSPQSVKETSFVLDALVKV